jgi:hypothetical protein
VITYSNTSSPSPQNQYDVPTREPGLVAAIEAAGGIRALARELGMSRQALSVTTRAPS